MKSIVIRETFLEYFEKQNHKRVRSSSLIPAADPTLLFTNAGMVQFKDCFLGVVDPGYRRATTSQKCVRAGGKHNDLENVGFTARHHTFFEMLGNFSFGDYFKEEAIAFAWELLTKTLSLPKDKLRVSVFETDDEAHRLWKAQGVPAEWIIRLGEKDNFWAMGDTGPCGPCTEIHYDWGSEYGCKKPDCSPACECGRFLEIWNLVFMQYNRDPKGNLTPLPSPSVDTGAGLERFAAVLQEVFSNYDTDLFQPIIHTIAKKVGKEYGESEVTDVSMKVIADHLRSGTFLMADGVTPSNEGRGYVLRRILRRAIRHGKKLGKEKPFIYEMVPDVVSLMGNCYPELTQNQDLIKDMLKEEEDRFHATLHRGMGILEEAVAKLEKDSQKILPGKIAFKLYDTFGFPFDLTEVICQEYSIGVDQKGFDECMEKQRSKSVWSEQGNSHALEAMTQTIQKAAWDTTFTGYGDSLIGNGQSLALFSLDGKETKKLSSPHEGFVILDKTPFYAESGGQVGDKGMILGEKVKAEVLDTFKISHKIVHRIKMAQGSLAPQQEVKLEVNSLLRKKISINHTATHVLHAALRKILGNRVKQAGSLVNSDRLRFDFTYPKPISPKERHEIESLVNKEIFSKHNVHVEEMNFNDAMKVGALAFFDEKYGDHVRVVRVDGQSEPFSVELCGGTHLQNIFEIGFLKILSESSIASGVRRIEAITSTRATDYLKEREGLLETIEERLGTKGEETLKKVEQLTKENKGLRKECEDLKIKLAQGKSKGTGESNALWDKKISFGEINVVMDTIDDANTKILRTLVDQVRDKLKTKTMVLLASQGGGKVTLCLGLTKDIAERYNAKDIIQPLAKEVGGTGGGRSDFAQAGGSNAENLPQVFKTFKSWLKENI